MFLLQGAMPEGIRTDSGNLHTIFRRFILQVPCQIEEGYKRGGGIKLRRGNEFPSEAAVQDSAQYYSRRVLQGEESFYSCLV
jgi:hypothetical protein